MARGRKKGEKIGKVTYDIIAVRKQGNSEKVVGKKTVSSKPSWTPKSAKRVEAGKKAIGYLRKRAKGAKGRTTDTYYNSKTGEVLVRKK